MIYYELLTGEHPFERANPFATASAIVSAPVNLAKVPATWRMVVARMLQRDRDDRYASATHFLESFGPAARALLGLRTDAPSEALDGGSVDGDEDAPLDPYAFWLAMVLIVVFAVIVEVARVKAGLPYDPFLDPNF